MSVFKKIRDLLGRGHTEERIPDLSKYQRALEGAEEKLGKALYFAGINRDRAALKEVQFTPQEYSLADVRVLYDVEAYFRQFVEKVVQRMFKQGFEIVGDKKAVEYVKARIELLEDNMQQPFVDFLEAISRDLVRYHNCFLEKIRNRKASKRYWRRDQHRSYPPVTKYQLLDPTKMRIAVSIHGRILAYAQLEDDPSADYWIDQAYPVWRPWDIVHIKIDKKPQELFGTPLVVPVIDDIKALRAMEESAEIIVHQFAKPILVFKIGTSRRKPGPSDIEEASNKLKSMATYGFLVTAAENEIDYIGANKTAIDISGYLQYARKRVLNGLGLDPITLGDGETANRNTAQSITESMIYIVQFYQRKLKEALEHEIFREWLLEGKIPGSATIFFPEIDLTALNTRENHALMLFQGNAITHEELRRELGRPPLKNNKDLFAERFNWYYTEKEIEADEKAKSKVDFEKSKRLVTQQTRPTNQYGTKPKPKIRKD